MKKRFYGFTIINLTVTLLTSAIITHSIMQNATAVEIGPADSDIDFSGVDTLTLDTLWKLVEKRNPAIKSAYYSWMKATTRPPQEEALNDPMAAISLAPLTARHEVGDTGARFDLSQQFPWPGKRHLRGQIARAAAASLEQDWEKRKQELRHTTQQAFFAYYLIEESLSLNQQQQTWLDELRKLATIRYTTGNLPQEEQIQAEIEYHHLLHERIDLNLQRAIVVARLNTLMRRHPALSLPPPETPPFTRLNLNPEKLIFAARTARPEIHKINHQIAGQETTIKLAVRQRRPDFTLMAAYDTMWNMSEERPMIGFAINIPLYQDRLRAAEIEAEYQLQEYTHQQEEILTMIDMEVQVAYETLQTNKDLLDLYERQLLPATLSAQNSAMAGYHSGSVEFRTVLLSLHHAAEMRFRLLATQVEYRLNLAALEEAVGQPLTEIITTHHIHKE